MSAERDAGSALRRLRRRGAGATRREVLQAALAGSAAWIAGCAVRSRAGRSSGPRVIVVGAGFAGLACARELLALGADVVVLEARGRIGGRSFVLNDLAAGAAVDAGGELIGTNQPHWMEYGKRYGLELVSSDDDESDLEYPIVLAGRRLSAAESEVVWRGSDELFARANPLAREIDGDRPWDHARAAEIDAGSVHAWIEEQDAEPLVKSGAHAMLGSEMGAPTRAQSLLALLSQIAGGGVERYWTESEVLRCRGGSSRLAHALAEEIGADRILLRTPVARIECGPEGAVVTTADGGVHSGDHVVLAIPPTTWDRIAIEPALPAGIAPQMGASVKFLSALKQRFWRTGGLAPSGLTDGLVSSTWEPSRAVDGAVLTAFSSGEGARLARELSGRGLRDGYTAALEQLFPGFARELVASRFIDWPSEEWTRGGYSIPAPGEVTTRVRALRNPHGSLVFAGEHVSTRFTGYMEGALESGTRAARVILGS